MKAYFLEDPSILLPLSWDWNSHGVSFMSRNESAGSKEELLQSVKEWQTSNNSPLQQMHQWTKESIGAENEEEIRTYAKEFLRNQIEITCLLEGEAILDIRSNLDHWIRIELFAGDMIVLNQGVYRRLMRSSTQHVIFAEAYAKHWAHKQVPRPLKDDIIHQKLNQYGPPLLYASWLESNRAFLQPPVGNKMMWNDGEFLVMTVSGPNLRRDYHINQGEEFFYQIKGDMWLAIEDQGVFRDIPVREGEMFVLPGGVPHSPQRKANTVGLVIERKRREGELDGLRWYCDHCGKILKEDYFVCTDLGSQLKVKIEEFYSHVEMRTCKSCGKVSEKPVDV
eukprot:TRINITY_DN2941_c0_g1_i1.p1 TRINITY_DN2941_c0_g1~~TRINITY_DN2941_c0_g1_i1.p1  ORF type:complete len:337 (+),score=65.87 TRINITY_DN2941_c0_g1_i1:51-1061(+)